MGGSSGFHRFYWLVNVNVFLNLNCGWSSRVQVFLCKTIPKKISPIIADKRMKLYWDKETYTRIPLIYEL